MTMLPRLPGLPEPPQMPELLGLKPPDKSVAIHATEWLGLSALMILLWGMTGVGYFWPIWVIMPTGMALAIHWVASRGAREPVPYDTEPSLFIHGGVSVVIGAFLFGVWLFSGMGYFWPRWPWLGLAVAFGAHALARAQGTKESERRIQELTDTRAGVVEEQDEELRRIERDLHDGAQARLVALSMTLGLAEQRMATDPEGARELVGEAKRGATDALKELRDLVRGISPPVLTDRGLPAALESLAAVTPVLTELRVDVPRRLPAAIETAAYFVAAEGLANAVKHADPASVQIEASIHEGVLQMCVRDDGRGGANPEGSGLTGLRRRVEALDGRLSVSSPPGGPTHLIAELPCA